MVPKSGAVVGSMIGFMERFQGRGRVILTASDAMQYAFEEETLVEGTGVHSLFSSAIINALTTFGADENKDGVITVDELYDYVDEYVTDRTPDQRPNIWAYGVQGDMLIATRPSTLPEPAPLAPPPGKIIQPPTVEKVAITPKVDSPIAQSPEINQQPTVSVAESSPPQAELSVAPSPEITQQTSISETEPITTQVEPLPAHAPEISEKPSSNETVAQPLVEPSMEPTDEVPDEKEPGEEPIIDEARPSKIPATMIRLLSLLGGLCFVLYPLTSGDYAWANALPMIGSTLLLAVLVITFVGKRRDSE